MKKITVRLITILITVISISLSWASVSSASLDNSHYRNDSSYLFSPGYLNAAKHQAEIVRGQQTPKKSLLDRLVAYVQNKSANSIQKDTGENSKITPKLQQKSSARGGGGSKAAASLDFTSGSPARVLSNGNVIRTYTEDGKYYFDILKSGTNELLVNKQQVDINGAQKAINYITGYDSSGKAISETIRVTASLIDNGSVSLIVNNSDNTSSVEVINTDGYISEHFSFDSNTSVLDVSSIEQNTLGITLHDTALDRDYNISQELSSSNLGYSYNKTWLSGHYENGTWIEGEMRAIHTEEFNEYGNIAIYHDGWDDTFTHYCTYSYNPMGNNYIVSDGWNYTIWQDGVGFTSGYGYATYTTDAIGPDMYTETASHGGFYENIAGDFKYAKEYYLDDDGNKVYTGRIWSENGIYDQGNFTSNWSYSRAYTQEGGVQVGNDYNGGSNGWFSPNDTGSVDYYQTITDLTNSLPCQWVDGHYTQVWNEGAYRYDNISSNVNTLTPMAEYARSSFEDSRSYLDSVYDYTKNKSYYENILLSNMSEDTSFKSAAKNLAKDIGMLSVKLSDPNKEITAKELLSLLRQANIDQNMKAAGNAVGEDDAMTRVSSMLANPTADQKILIDSVLKLLNDMKGLEKESTKNSELKKTSSDLLQAVANILLSQAMPDLLKKGDMTNIRTIFSELDTAKSKIMLEYSKSTKPYYENILEDLSRNMAILQAKNILNPDISKEELERLPPSELDKILDKVRNMKDRSFEEDYLLQQESKYRKAYDLEQNKKKFQDDIRSVLDDFTRKINTALTTAKSTK